MIEITKAEVRPGAPVPTLHITLSDGEVQTMPLTPPMMWVLNAGGWLMREYIAGQLESDIGSSNVVSRRIRQMAAGERPTEDPKSGAAAA